MQKFVNNFSSTVAQTLGVSDTFLTIAAGDGAKLPSLAVDDFVLVTLYRLDGVVESGHEVVKCTSITGDMLTIERSVEGAAASQFLIGDKVQARATAATFDQLQVNIGSKADSTAVTEALVGKQATITVSGILKGSGTDVTEATAGTDYVNPDAPSTFTATQTFKGVRETVYSLAGTVIDIANGTIQYKTLAENTTFTENLSDGDAVTLLLNPATYTTTWPTITWVGSTASTAPTLVASVYNCIVVFQLADVVYGRYVGRV